MVSYKRHRTLKRRIQGNTLDTNYIGDLYNKIEGEPLGGM